MLGRFARDESGMTMGLVVIMIVLIGVMGAGLLTFVQRDLESVIEVNRGQKAFEMADAGIKAAKQQLTLEPTLEKYDGSDAGTVDIQWAASKGGKDLPSLDSTPASANVQVLSNSPSAGAYTVTSTGCIPNCASPIAKRRVQAVFEKTASKGLPAYFTPGSIEIKDGNSITSVSMFAGGNIIIEPISGVAGFKNDYETNGGALKVNTSVKDELGDWNSPPWNTVGRRGYTGYPVSGASAFDGVGFAAEGRICGSSSCSSDANSIADGVYGYDTTTGSKGNGLRFVNKVPADKTPNDTGTITYPFPRPTPDAEYLLGLAKSQVRSGVGTPESRDNYLDLRSPPLGAGDSFPGNLDAFYPDATVGRVVFIDANGTDINFSTSNPARNKGIIVVRCATTLKFTQKFEGIIIALAGTTGVHGSDCGADERGKVLIEKVNAGVDGYVYAEHDSSSPSIKIIGGSGSDTTKVGKLPDGVEFQKLLGLSGLGGAPSIELDSWRELYQ